MQSIKKIIIAVDNDSTAEKVTSYGAKLAMQLNSELALVSAVDLTMLITEGAITPKEFADITVKDYKKNQQILADNYIKNISAATFVEIGHPHEVILNTARLWQADLIVLGTHGRKGISHLIMGSVAEKLIRHSEIPVLIIPI